MVATTQSNGAAFGSGVCVPGCGFFLNNFMYSRGGSGFFPTSWHPNYPEPGKRPLNNHSPTLAFKDGKPFMAFGSPAGRRQQGACAQVFVHVVDHGMGIQESISAPRAHCEGNKLWMESRVPKKIRETLKSIGHDVIDREDYTMFFGGLNGVLVNPETGRLHGGADPRRPCAAVGY
jgi:gamma-glutamyltranspeptidase/glutathione hydrolase